MTPLSLQKPKKKHSYQRKTLKSKSENTKKGKMKKLNKKIMKEKVFPFKSTYVLLICKENFLCFKEGYLNFGDFKDWHSFLKISKTKKIIRIQIYDNKN